MTAVLRNEVPPLLKSGRGRGFTMVEMVVVIAIMGLLVAVLPVYLKGSDHLFVKRVTFLSCLPQEGCQRLTGGGRMWMDGGAVVRTITTAGAANG